MRSPLIDWQVSWERDVTADEHVELAAFIRATHGAAGSPYAELFEGRRSWPGVRPELRVIGRDAAGCAAHVGMLRRFVRVGEVDQLVAEIGMVAVRPDLQKTGVGLEAAHRMLAVLRDLGAPYAFGTAREEVLRFYRAAGSYVLPGVRLRTFDSLRPWTLHTSDDRVLITPIAAAVEDWPAGDIVDRNGQEL
jgi:nodulation protein A